MALLGYCPRVMTFLLTLWTPNEIGLTLGCAKDRHYYHPRKKFRMKILNGNSMQGLRVGVWEPGFLGSSPGSISSTSMVLGQPLNLS